MQNIHTANLIWWKVRGRGLVSRAAAGVIIRCVLPSGGATSHHHQLPAEECAVISYTHTIYTTRRTLNGF